MRQVARLARGLGEISFGFHLAVAGGGEGGLEGGAGGEFPNETGDVGSGLGFKSRAAYRQTTSKCAPQILESMMKPDVFILEENVGDVIGDLTRRRSMIQGQEPTPGGIRVEAEAPHSAMFGTIGTIGDLRAMPSGRSQFSMEFSHCARCPRKVFDARHHQSESEGEVRRAGGSRSGGCCGKPSIGRRGGRRRSGWCCDRRRNGGARVAGVALGDRLAMGNHGNSFARGMNGACALADMFGGSLEGVTLPGREV